MSKVNVTTCHNCPMFALSCGMYEEDFCQHPDAPENLKNGNMSTIWGDSDFTKERHPDCPLVANSVTIIAT